MRRAICSAADPAALAYGEFLGEQHLDCLDGGELTPFELPDQLIERLQSARHAQSDQVAANALDRRLRQGAPHEAALVAASRLPTLS
jgi:hypothetical protein